MRFWGPYVSVAERRAKAVRKMEKLRKEGKDIRPVKLDGRTIARSFWGKGWCDHLESFSDFENRLPRGRRYVRNGSVCHMAIEPGHIEAIVSGSELYNVDVKIDKLEPAVWKSVKRRCSGQIGSMLELLQGKLSDQVMTVVTDRDNGLFPQPREIELHCSCPDWAVMCKHVAAVMYGVGSRLDSYPGLLFLLRDVDAQELISAEMKMPVAAAKGDVIGDDQLGDVFGIDLDVAGEEQPAPKAKPKKQRGAGKRAATAKKGKTSRTATRRKPATKTGRSKTRKVAKPKPAVRKKTTPSAAKGKTKTTPSAAKGRTKTGRIAVTTGATPKIRPTGKSVARLRKQLGLSVAEFARRLDVSAASVYRWEAATGQLKLQAHPLAALAKLHRQARAE